MPDTQSATGPDVPMLHVEVTFQATPGPWTWEDVEAFSDRLMCALLDKQAAHPWLNDPDVSADCRAGTVTAGATVAAGLRGAGHQVLVEAGMSVRARLVLECPPLRRVRRDRTRTRAGTGLKAAARHNASHSAP